MEKLGYIRVSTNEQNLNLQRDSLLSIGVDENKIYEKIIFGARSDRPQRDALSKAARTGDVIYVWRLDHLGRSLKHLVEIIDKLKECGIGFASIQDGIDTTTISGELVFGIFASLAQYERNLIAERTRAGLKAAKARSQWRQTKSADRQADADSTEAL